MKMAPKFKLSAIKLVVGLGNPGVRYARTYHNTGRMAVTALANVPEKDFKPSTDYLSYRATDRIFIIPRTFMNGSGLAIKSALRALRAKPRELLVVHDDADLTLGTYRLAWARGAAGHRGVESIMSALGTKEFWRLRIGIRSPAFEKKKADAFVLCITTRADETSIRGAVEKFAEKYLTPEALNPKL